MTKGAVLCLGGGPEGDEGRDQQPEQALHQKEEKTPEAESFDPLTYAHTTDDYRDAAAFPRNAIASLSSGRTLSAYRPNSTIFR